jgi:glutamine amidotransferase
MIVIIDYSAGNPASILNMLRKAGTHAIVSSDKSAIAEASKLILPGVGAFDHGMNNLQSSGLIEVLHKKVILERTPFLGICLGMQLLAKNSEEGNQKGLSWIDGSSVQFRFPQNNIKVPHMGWNFLNQKKPSRLFENMYPEAKFYFVHSYYLKCNHEEDILCSTEYGFPFTSAVEKDTICGVQFHPEKSHKYGLRLLQNFISNF